MEDNICEEITIKIKWGKDTFLDVGNIWKRKSTNLPLNGKYEDESGDINYFKNGILHNENGPAIIRRDGQVSYWINGKIHRIDGPAGIYPDGNCVWWINDLYIENEIIENWLKENDIPLDWGIWTDSDKMLFALHWSDYNG